MVKSEVWFEKGIRAASVEDLFLNPKAVLGDKVEPSELVNIYFTVAECLEESGRKLLIQHHIPFDVDKLNLPGVAVSTAELLPIAQTVCATLGVEYNKVGVLFSGNGLQFFVGVTTPITDVAYFDQARRHYVAICAKIDQALRKAGLPGEADKSVWSPARLMRMPDTLNVKPDKPQRMARVLQSNIERLPWSLEVKSGLPQVAVGEALNAGVLADLITPDVKAIMGPEGCRFLSYAHLNPEKLSEPEWYAALSIVARFPEGRKFAHKMSEGHPGYSFEETETKIGQALEASGPRTCKSIDALSDKCKGCSHHQTSLVSPICIEGPDHVKTEKSGFYEVVFDKDGNIKRGKPAYGELWKVFCRKHKYVSIRNTAFIYVFKEKFWEEMSRDDILAFAQDHFDPKPNANMREEFFKWVKVHYLQNMDWFSTSVEGKLNFENGIYDVATGELLPHSPEYGFRNVLPCRYDPEAVAPRFNKFMREVTVNRKELIDVLQEFMGYIFGNMACKHEKILMLLGEGSNGKSTFVKLIRALCGPGAHAGLSVKAMNNDQNRYLLEGKLVNIAEENSKDSFKDTELLKNFASGGIIMVKKLFTQPYEYENRTKLVMLANALPANFDQTHGFYRKLLICPFDACFTKGTMDKNLYKQLLLELPGIFNFAMEGCRRLRDHEEFTDSAIIDASIENYHVTTDSVRAWFNEEVRLGSDNDTVSTQELYTAYTQYCVQTGSRYPVHQTPFGRQLRKLLEARGHVYQRVRRRVDEETENRHWKIMGIKLLQIDV